MSPADVVAEAQAREESARALTVEWQQRIVDVAGELGDVESRIGDTLLEDPDEARRLTARAAELREERDNAHQAAEAALRRWEKARDAIPAAEAELVRQQADQLWVQAVAHRAAGLNLLDRLEAHEGVAVLAQSGQGTGPQLAEAPFTKSGLAVARAVAMDQQALQLELRVSPAAAMVRSGKPRKGQRRVWVILAGKPEPGRSVNFTVLADGDRLALLPLPWNDPTMVRWFDVPAAAVVEVVASSLSVGERVPEPQGS